MRWVVSDAAAAAAERYGRGKSIRAVYTYLTRPSLPKYSYPPRWMMQERNTRRRLVRDLTLMFGLLGTAVLMILAVPGAAKHGHKSTHASLPSFPLAVKSPYLSTWVPGNEVAHAPTAQPQFWAGQSITWSVLVRVNGTTYTLFGVPQGVSGATEATTNDVSFTSSHSVFSLTAGPVDLTLDFFSPVYPGKDDYALQSLPYSYLTVNATATDDSLHTIEVLSAIDQTWTAQKGAADLNFTQADSTGFFWFYNPENILFTEVDDMATYGSVLFATAMDDAVTYGCDTPAALYKTFSANGILTTPSSCTGTDLAALSKVLDDVNTTSSSVTFAVGFERDATINYVGETQTSFHRTKWPTPQDAIPFFLSNYDSAFAMALNFDAYVRSKAEAVSSTFGSKYADIIEASVRQTFAAMELTVAETDVGNSSAQPWAFLKEISSDGNTNTVDLIYQTWPVFINLNPEWIKMLFLPILELLQAGKWPHEWVIHDIGTHYPNATGHPLGFDESMPLFETSTLFILLLAYQQYANDTSFAQQYETLLEGYAHYLVDNSLYPALQLISVDAIKPTANQTALAVQSVIGLKAASVILGNDTYADYAADYAKTIYDDALGLDGESLDQSTHFTYNYGDDASWNVLFASYSDVLLELDTFPASAWKMQSEWYSSQMQIGGLPFAGPQNESHYTGKPIDWGITDWNIVVASVSSDDVQEAVIDTTWTFMTNGMNTIPFGTKYVVEGEHIGKWEGNKARSTVGSHFALMALQQGFWEDLYT